MDKIIDQIATLLTVNLKAQRNIKQIYKGDVILIPENSLPCIIIDPVSTVVEQTDSENDQRINTVQISCVLEARKHFNKDSNELSSKATLVDIMEETETTGMKPKTDTVLGVIRERLDDDSDFVLKVDIGPIEYIFSDNRNFPTVEASMIVTATTILYLRATT